MKAAYLALATALAVSAVASARPGSAPLSPDSATTQSERPGRAAGTARNDHTQDESSGQVTTVRNGDSLASVTQSGDPATVERHVEKRPGYTKLEQRSGSSRSVIVQSDNPADLPLDQFPRAFRELLRK